MSLPGPDLHYAGGPWYFEDYRNIFLPNIGEDSKKVLPSHCGAPGTVPCGNNYCITKERDNKVVALGNPSKLRGVQ